MKKKLTLIVICLFVAMNVKAQENKQGAHALTGGDYVFLQLKDGAYVTFKEKSGSNGPFLKVNVHISQLAPASKSIAIKSTQGGRMFIAGYIDLRSPNVLWADYVYRKGAPEDSFDMYVPHMD